MKRTVVVTGAGSGIGLAIAQAFAEAGDAVFACDVSPERVEAAVATLGDSAQGGVVDVSSFDQVKAFVEGAASETGRLDVMVNNAGVADGKPSITETSIELWRRVLDINLDGCFYGCKVAAEIMISQGNGRIINIASVSSFRGGMNGIPYTVSKAGILGLTRRMAFDGGPSGVTTNAICPGAIATDIPANSRSVLGADFPESSQGIGTPTDMIKLLVPAGRRGSPEEVAAVALFLASEAAGYVNGVAVPVDGGWLAA
jgi:NAD(P)-dependent dehydrogenase (short-subunit alcohol dehydrogenase family)